MPNKPLTKKPWFIVKPREQTGYTHGPLTGPELMRFGTLRKGQRLPHEGETREQCRLREASEAAKRRDDIGGHKTCSDIGAPVRAIEGDLTQVDLSSFGASKAIRSTIYRPGETQVRVHGKWLDRRRAIETDSQARRAKARSHAAMIAACLAKRADLIEPRSGRVLMTYNDAVIEADKLREQQKRIARFDVLKCRLP